MKFFVDNNLSPHIAEGLRAFGENVVHIKEVFPEGEDDLGWLPHIGKNKMILISRDLGLRRNPAEIQAIRDNHVGAFFLGGKNLTRCQLVQQVVRNWPRIKTVAARRAREAPYIYRVPPKGTTFVEYEL